MSKMGFKRYDIWYGESINNIDNHFYVIVSNFKNNMKNDDLTVCLISSQIKNHPCHVNLDAGKFGLNKEGQVRCENIFTVSKSRLQRKVGEIDDIKKQIEIDRALEIQLQLDRHNVNDLEHLEENFINITNIESELLNLNKKVRDYTNTNKYDECIKTCNEMFDKAKKIKKQNYMWFASYHLSLMYIKICDYSNALEYARESLKYVDTIQVSYKKYAFSMWLLARIYEEFDINKSINIYKSLIKYHKLNNNLNMRIACLSNIAKLRNDSRNIKRIIAIVEGIEIDSNKTNLTKDSLMKQLEEDLRGINH